ncbi:bacteriophage T4 gp5 trimerization domain-containing protein [Pseudomonas sp. NY15463]|uniref:bacteriophage T4 gp5 trimerisation domain-containing protein n=1 Tax=Pseudomonas sp. NY15463 TaxID=3400361 RepID=UPI003A893CF3
MTIKSQTHKGDGFNELRFEDELDRQEVFIHQPQRVAPGPSSRAARTGPNQGIHP